MKGNISDDTAEKQYFLEMQSVVDTRDDPFIVVDRDYCIRSVNAPFERQYQFSSDVLIGKKCYEVTRMNGIACHELGETCPYYQVFKLGKPATCRHTHYTAHGQLRRVLVKGYPLKMMGGDVLLGMSFNPFAEQGTSASFPIDNMAGQSPEFTELMDKLKTAALTSAPVLLAGETGTGKKLAASFIHGFSDRRDRPFVAIDCSVLSETVFESELFGNEQSSFNETINRKEGLVELARNGTLFLDEISEIPGDIQHKLLHMLETGEFRRAGGRKPLKTDVRLICSSSSDLNEHITNHEFRRDLYYRLSVFTVNVPPLRKRLSDIPLLAEELLNRISRNVNKEYRLTEEALNCLKTYDYSGNIDELLTILQSAASFSSGNTIGMSEIGRYLPLDQLSRHDGSHATASVSQAMHTKNLMHDIEERHVRDMLMKHANNGRSAALALGISERTLYRKMRHYGIK